MSPLNQFDDELQRLDDDQAPSADPNPFYQTILDQRSARESTLRRSMRTATDTTPERAAEVRRLSDQLRVPAPIIDRDFERYQKQGAVEGRPYAAMQDETPALAQWTAKPENAALAQDDLEQLGLLEWLVTAPQRAFAQSAAHMRMAELRTKSLFRDLTREELDALNSEKFLTESGARLGAGDSWFRGAVTSGSALLANVLFGAQRAGAKGVLGAVTGAFIGGAGGAVVGGVGAIPGAAAGAKFGLSVGLGVGAAQFGFELEAGLAYDEFQTNPDFTDDLGRPLDQNVAKVAALAAGGLNAGLEVVGLGILAKSIPGLNQLKGAMARTAIATALKSPTVRAALRDALGSYGGVVTKETAVEVAQRAITILSGELGKAVSGQPLPMRTPDDVMADLGREAVGAAQGFAFVGLPGPTLSLAHDVQRARQAQHNATWFTALGEGVSQSKTVTRMPAAAQELLEQATKDGPIGTLYAPLDTWTTYWQEKGIDPAEMAATVTGDRAALATARETGVDLAIPTARYAVTLAGTEHNGFFGGELRLGPEEMNAREATAFIEEQRTKQEAEAGLPAAEPSSREQVRRAVSAQLVTGGQFTAATAEPISQLLAAGIGTLAEEAGLDPAALYSRYGLTVARPTAAEAARVTPGAPSEPSGGAAPPAAPAAPVPPAGSDLVVPGETAEAIPGLAELEAELGGATLEPRGEETFTANVSETGLGSEEENRRLAAMTAAGQTFVVYDRAGRRRVIPTGGAVDYHAQNGETFGVESRTGFEIHEHRGGKVPGLTAPAAEAQTGVADAEPEGDRLDLRATGDDPAVGLFESRPSVAENEVARLVRRRTGESDTALASRRRRYVVEAHAVRRTQHYGALFAHVAHHAAQLQPDVDRALLQREFAIRIDLWEEAASTYTESGHDPLDLLKAIADRGGLNTADPSFPGEVALLMEGQTFGRVRGVKGVFQKDSRQTLDLLATSLRQDDRYAWITTPDVLTEAIDDAIRHPALYTEGVYPGSDQLAVMGMDPTTEWWADSWLGPVEGEEISFDVSTFEQGLFDLFGEPAPAPAAQPTLEELKARNAERRAQVEQEIVEAGATPAGVRLIAPSGRALVVHPSTQEAGRWQLTAFTDEGTPSGHDLYDSFAEAYRSARGLYGTQTYGPPFGGSEFVPITQGATAAPALDAFYPVVSDVVDGLVVRAEVPNTDSISASLSTYRVLPGIRAVPFGPTPPPTFINPQTQQRTEALRDAIAASGEVNPLIVVIEPGNPDPDYYYILEGSHRFDALLMLGKTAFPALVVIDEDSLPAEDVLDTGEVQPRLPAAGAVRDQEVATPAIEAPFALTATEDRATKGTQTELFQPVYHGSPYIFEKFSLHSIGNGEGHQAFGYGLYFASLRDVAEGYRERLAGKGLDKRLVIDGVSVIGEEDSVYGTLNHTTTEGGQLGRGLLELFARAHFKRPGKASIAALRDELTRSIANYEVVFAEGRTFSGDLNRDLFHFAAARAALAALEKWGDRMEILPAEKPGRTYKVEIPDDAHFLDWDKPIAEQPSIVKTALVQLGFTIDAALTIPDWAHAEQLFGVGGSGLQAMLIAERMAANIETREILNAGRYYVETRNAEAWAEWYREHSALLDRKLQSAQAFVWRGEDIYRELHRRAATVGGRPPSGGWSLNQEFAKVASAQLAAHGVAGLRYFDGLSRSVQEGTANYVVFDDRLIEVVEFYQDSPRLTAIHQLTAENLASAEALGALAVPSIAVQPEGSGALHGFGEITLLGGRDLADPAQHPVFDADAWSMTFPAPEYRKAKMKPTQALVNTFRRDSVAYEEDGKLSEVWDHAVSRPRPEESIQILRRSLMAKAVFLREQGVTPAPPVLVPKELEAGWVTAPSFQAFLAASGGAEQLGRYGVADTAYRQQLTAAVRAALVEHTAAITADAEAATRELIASLEDEWFNTDGDGLFAFGRTPRVLRSLDAIGKVRMDVGATQAALDAQMVGRTPAFQAWVDRQILGLHPAPEITLRRRKVPYTLENIVERMTATVSINAQQQHMTFGEGKARAAAARRFSSVEHMRNVAAYAIKPESEVNEARARAQQLLADWRGEVLGSYTETDWRGQIDTWHGLDASMRAVARWAKSMRDTPETRMRKALSAEGFSHVPASVVAQGVEAARAFMDAPVPYFESKPQRAVQLTEFAGAVVPATATPATRAILAKAGLSVMDYDPGNTASRDAAINALRTDLAATRPEILFQPTLGGKRGSIVIGPNRTITINLFEKADLSTVLHETGHFFLEVFGDVVDGLGLKDPAQLTPSQRRMLGDYGAILQLFGVENRREIGRAQHEQWARLFEVYLAEGRAPSEALRSAFGRFRAWFLGIYRALRNMDATLTPEVRAIFDRMLASEQAITEAEARGRMEPLFLTAEAAGMTPARFGLYRSTIEAASRTAREELDGKLLAEIRREQEGQWRAERDEVRAEVASTVQQQPVYKALAAMRAGKNPDGTPLVEGLITPPLKLSRRLIVDRFGIDRLRALPKPYVYSAEGGLDPETVAQRFGFGSGDELLTAITEAPAMGQAIDRETDRLMIDRHGSLLLDGSVTEAAQAATANADRALVIRTELRALGQLRRSVAPFEDAVRAEGAEKLRDAGKERAYERRWLEAETRLRIAIAEGRKQVEIDALRGELANLKGKARSGGATLRGALPPADAIRQIGEARIAATRYRDLKPAVFWSAARRASQAATEAAARQDFDAAIQAKTQELLHLALYREAETTLAEIESRITQARDLNRPATQARLGLAGGTFLDQILGILDRYDFARVSGPALERRAQITKWVAAMEGEGLPVDLPDEVLNDARRINYQDVTVAELIGITDGIAQILHLARLASRLLKGDQKAELDAAATEMATSIRAQGRRRREPRRDRPPGEERRRAVEDWFAGHRKLASLVRVLDGFQDGGPVWDAFLRPLNDAGAREAEMNAEATARFAALIERAYPGRSKRLLYERQHVPAVGRSLSQMERLMVALNWGNDGNRDRIQRGEGWSTEQVQSILDTLTPADADFVQGVFDLLDSYWPAIKAKQERVYGLAPARVEAATFRLGTREMTGGYFPLKYDDRLSATAISKLDLDAANLARYAAYAHATTKRNHTQARVATLKEKVRLDFGPMFEHVDQVIHDLTHHEALLDIGRLIGHKAVQDAILETQGDLVYKQIRNTIRDVAFGDVPARGGVERFINHIRAGATIAGLGWNLTTAMLQPIGLTNSAVRIGPRWVLRGLARWFRHPTTMIETVDWIMEQSAFMRSRGRTQQREIAEIRRRIGVDTGVITGWVEASIRGASGGTVSAQGVADSYFWMIQAMQRMADVPTWLGAYEKAMADPRNLDANGLHDEARAVALADQAVLDSQGGGQMKDLSEVQRGGPMMRLWTNFYSFFNVLYNQAAESTQRTRFTEPADVGRLASDYLMLFIVPAVISYMVRAALRPGEEDDEDALAWRLALEVASYMSGTMIGLREISATLQGYYGYDGPAGARFFAALSRLGQQARQGEPDAAFRRAAVDVGGTVLHLPAGQINKTLDGIMALDEGKTQNPAAVVLGGPRR